MDEVARAWAATHPELVDLFRKAFQDTLTPAEREQITRWVTRTVMRGSVGVLRLRPGPTGSHAPPIWATQRRGAPSRGFQMILEEAEMAYRVRVLSRFPGYRSPEQEWSTTTDEFGLEDALRYAAVMVAATDGPAWIETKRL